MDGEFDPDKRLADPADDDCSISRIEVDFGLRVHMSQAQQRRLLDVLEEIVNSPANQPVEGVHWLGFVGGKLSFSVVDRALLGRPPPSGGEAVPANGEEPSFDDDVFCASSTARGFVSEKERARVERRRVAEAALRESRSGPSAFKFSEDGPEDTRG